MRIIGEELRVFNLMSQWRDEHGEILLRSNKER